MDRELEIASDAYDLDTRATFEAIEGIFDTIEIDGTSLGDMFSLERSTAISDSLGSIREIYEWMGVPVDATQEELDAGAEVDAYWDEYYAYWDEYWNDYYEPYPAEVPSVVPAEEEWAFMPV